MHKPRSDDACRFLHAHARLIERRLFTAEFEGGDADGVIDVLAGYRNPDGGFGHGLEPDKRVPGSQPLDVEVAFQIMDAVGRVDHSMVVAACDYLQTVGPGVGCLTAGYESYPHAPHWEAWAIPPSVNPTAGIVALLWKWDIDHPWRTAATSFCQDAIQAGLPDDAHGFGEVLHFLAHAPVGSVTVESLRQHLGGLSWFQPEPASGYGVTPLQYAPSPDSHWSALFEPGVIDRHLDALTAAQRADGGWPIAWEPLSPAAEWECRGMETLRALRVLRAYGRV